MTVPSLPRRQFLAWAAAATAAVGLAVRSPATPAAVARPSTTRKPPKSTTTTTLAATTTTTTPTTTTLAPTTTIGSDIGRYHDSYDLY